MSDDTPTRAVENEPTDGRPVRPTPRPARTESGPGARRFGYLVSIAFDVIFLYLANGIPNWNVPLFTNDWPDVLPIVNLSLGASIVANLLFMAYDPRWFRHGVQMVLNVISIIVIYTLYRVFPFDLGQPQWNRIAHLALLVGIFGLAVAFVVELVGLVTDRPRWQVG